MRGRCVAPHCQDERLMVKAIRVVSSLGPLRSVASSLIDRITSNVAYTHHLKRRCVAPHFQDQRLKVKVTRVVSRFGLVRSMASSLFGLRTPYVAYIQHTRWRCVAHHFQDEMSQVKVAWVIRNVYLVRSMASFLFDRIISYVIYEHEGAMCHAPVFVICLLGSYMPIWLAFGGWGLPHLLDPYIYIFPYMHALIQHIYLSKCFYFKRTILIDMLQYITPAFIAIYILQIPFNQPN